MSEQEDRNVTAATPAAETGYFITDPGTRDAAIWRGDPDANCQPVTYWFETHDELWRIAAAVLTDDEAAVDRVAEAMHASSSDVPWALRDDIVRDGYRRIARAAFAELRRIGGGS